MSLQMDLAKDHKLIDSIQAFLKLQAAARAGGYRDKQEPEQILLDAFRITFVSGGLEAIDRLIASLNQEIKARGGSEGLGQGAALQNSDSEHPAFVHIFFTDFASDKILARVRVPLPSTDVSPQ